MKQTTCRVLAQHSHARLILHYPEFQMIQVIWNRSILFFSETEFMHLLEMISQASLDHINFSWASLRLSETEDGCIELWVGVNGLHLLPFDFLLLSSMLWTAMESLSKNHQQEMQPMQPEPMHETPRFSSN